MNCPYCLSEIENAGDAVECRSCGSSYHSECWSENGGCCAKGCERAVVSINLEAHPEQTSKLEISREAVETAAPHSVRRISNPCIRCGRQVPEGELHCSECEPARPENQDARNVGPLLVVLSLIALALGWLLAAVFLADGQLP